MNALPLVVCVALAGCAADGRVALPEQTLLAIAPGLSQAEIAALVGEPMQYLKQSYGDGTGSWTYRYRDAGIAKLLHVIFDAAGGVLRHSTEWDPDVYSKGGSRDDSGGR